MEFGYSKEQVLLREMYKKFAETEIKPLAEELDEEERFPVESIPKLARYGFMGIPFPKEYGGAGGNYTQWQLKNWVRYAQLQQLSFPLTHLCVQVLSITSVQKNRNRNIWYPWQRAKKSVHSV